MTRQIKEITKKFIVNIDASALSELYKHQEMELWSPEENVYKSNALARH